MLAEIGKKIGRKCHISSSRAIKEVLPYIRVIFQTNPKMAEGIAKWLNLSDGMITYIAGER